jgi:glutathione S-transferase
VDRGCRALCRSDLIRGERSLAGTTACARSLAGRRGTTRGPGLDEVEKPLLLASANRALFTEASRDEDEAQMALAKLDRPMKVLDAHLVNRPYLLGERFTVADLNVATVMNLAPQCGISLAAWPYVQAWHQACLERPAAADWKDVKFSVPRPPTPLGLLKMFV